MPEQKPACEACHRGKRQCPGGIPCARCAAKGVECREWVRAKRQSKKRAIESPDEDEKPIDNPQPPARKRGRPRKSPEAVDGADRREPANEPDEVVQSNYDQILETNRTTMNVTEIGVVEVVEEIAPTFPLFDPLRSFSFGSSGELSPRAELWMASHEPSDYFNFSIRGEPAAVNIRKLQNDVGYSEDSEDAEHGRNLMEAPKRVPGSWNPPISPPPQTVDAFFSFFPSSDRLPPAEQVNSLMSTFREQCSSMFVYLHNEVLPAPNDPSFVGSLCLAAIQWSEDAEINRSSIDIQYRLFVRSMQRILAVLDKYLPERSLFVIPHPDDPVDLVKTAREDQELDPLCETVFSIAMLAFWAYNRGLAKLFEQLVDVAFRMMFRIGLHRDILYGPEHLFGQTNPRQAWIRRSQRRTLFFILLYFLK